MIICLLLLLVSSTASGLAAETYTVGSEGKYTSVQDAINAASAGDIILVQSGTYYEDLVVDKKLTLKGVDTGSGKPIIHGSGKGDVVVITADGVNFEDFEVLNSEKYSSAILVKSSDNVILDNTVMGSNEGIRLEHGSHNLVARNTLTGNHGDGIYIHFSDYNTITHNSAVGNEFGVQGEGFRGNVITANTCQDNNQIDIYLESVADSVISDNQIEDNEQASRNGGDGIGMRYGTNITIKGNTVGKHYYGIKVYGSDKTTVSDNLVNGSGVNIRFDFGTNHSAIRNNTVSNGIDNILIEAEGGYNVVEANTVFGGKDSIYLFRSDNNYVSGNNVYGSTYGIRLYVATGNTITGNYLHDNTNDVYPSSDGNTVSDNSARANFFGEETTPTPVVKNSTSTTGNSSTGKVPSSTPINTGDNSADIFSWFFNMLHGLLS